MPILNSLSVLGAHFSAPAPAGNWYDDASDAHHTVTLNGSVTQSDEGSGVKAALFDGNGYLSLADSSLNAVAGDFTFEVFAYPTSNSGYRDFISLGVYTSGILARSFASTSDVVYIANNLALSNNNWLTLNSWKHIALVRSSGIFTVYINGFAVTSLANTDALDFSTIFVGDAVQGAGIEGYIGKLANVRLIIGTALYTSDFSVPTTLPTAVSGTQLLLNFGATAVPSV